MSKYKELINSALFILLILFITYLKVVTIKVQGNSLRSYLYGKIALFKELYNAIRNVLISGFSNCIDYFPRVRCRKWCPPIIEYPHKVTLELADFTPVLFGKRLAVKWYIFVEGG